MGIKDMVEKMWCEDLIFEDIMDLTWTQAQIDLSNKGSEAEDEMSDLGLEMINDDEVEKL